MSGDDTPTRRRLTVDWLLVMLAVPFVVARAVVLLKGKPFTGYDTFSYAYRGDPFYDRGELVSFTGEAPRLWGVPLLYSFFDGDMSRAAAQWAIGTFAWLLLASVLLSRFGHPAAKLVAGGGVLLLGLTAQVTNWDFAILSESLSISLGIITVALFLRWRQTGSRWVLGAGVIAALWWTFTRGEIRLAVGILLVMVIWQAWGNRQRRKPAIVAAVILVLALGWVTAITPKTNETFPRWGFSGLTAEEDMLMYRLRLQVLPDPETKKVYVEEFGMPSCPPAEAVAAGQAWDMDGFAAAYKSCPELRAWGEQNALNSGMRFAAAEPGLFLKYTWSVLPDALGGGIYAEVPTVLPAMVQRAFFPPPKFVVPFVLGGLLLALLAAVLAGGWRRRRGLTVGAAIVAATCLATLVFGLTISVGENRRFGIQEAIGLRIAAILLVAIAVDALTEKVRDRRKAAVTVE